ncbi:TetR/AcrR family transcriptional regulator [Pseudonocardia xishanensis]|uniref:TetR/AcrR family transcriptional regulator n=1 Tax=Pseudonocardia xishanensis TaxID=630995 RepID=A0ABP8RIV9_9PSEU
MRDRENHLAPSRSAGPAGVTGGGISSATLIRSAAALFLARGYATSTTRDLAEALGIRKASLYHYIDGKEDLLYAICKQSLDELSERIRETIAVTSPEDCIKEVIATHLRTVLARKDMYSVTLMETRSLTGRRKAEILESRESYRSLVGEAVRQGQATGQIRSDVDTRFLTMALLNHLNWVLFWYTPEDGPAEDLAVIYTLLYLEGAARPV